MGRYMYLCREKITPISMNGILELEVDIFLAAGGAFLRALISFIFYN